MNTCLYCGRKVYLFSHSHKEYENKYTQEVNDFDIVASGYFTGRINSDDIVHSKVLIRVNYFQSDDDISQISDKEIRAYTASIHHPFPPSSMSLIDDYLNAVDVSYSQLNRNGAMDEFKKLMKSFMMKYFTGVLALPMAYSKYEKVLSKFPMVQSNIEDTYFYVLNKIATNFIQNELLSDAEQLLIDNYANYLTLRIKSLSVSYQNSEISKLSQVIILKSIQCKIIPWTNISASIIPGKNETILWAYTGISFYHEKITHEWVGRNHGMSFRIIKGVYYHIGHSKGHSVEHSSMKLKGTGSLFLTNKELILYFQTNGMKTPFNKIVSITQYSDGIEVHKDKANVKRMTIQEFVHWFIMNLLSIENIFLNQTVKLHMKFQEAIVTIIDEFGREILNKPNVVNILSDFNAYEESKTFKVILRTVISEGYLDKILYVKDWDKSSARIVDKFIDNTGFQEDKAIYILNSLAFGLGLTVQLPHFSASSNVVANSPTSTPTKAVNPVSYILNSSLNLTASKLEDFDDDKVIQYKEKADSYIDSITEFKGDIKKELGAEINVTSDYDPSDNSLRFRIEINGPVTVKHESIITFNYVLYGAGGKIVSKMEAYRYKSKKQYEVLESDYAYENQYKTIGNISKVIMYWDIN